MSDDVERRGSAENDPRALRVGDVIVFTALPDEWAQPGFRVHASTRRFVEWLARHRVPCTVDHHDPDGFPFSRAVRRWRRGRLVTEAIGICETTGWHRVSGADAAAPSSRA